MRTTVSIQDGLLERAKEEARRRKCTLGEIVDDALRYRLVERSQGTVVAEPALPTYGLSGLHPGVDLTDSRALEQIILER